MPADFLLGLANGLANGLAYDLLKAGGNRLRDRIQGDAQMRALRRVYTTAFEALLDEIGDGLSQADVETLAAHAVRPFLNRPDVAAALISGQRGRIDRCGTPHHRVP